MICALVAEKEAVKSEPTHTHTIMSAGPPVLLNIMEGKMFCVLFLDQERTRVQIFSWKGLKM